MIAKGNRLKSKRQKNYKQLDCMSRIRNKDGRKVMHLFSFIVHVYMQEKNTSNGAFTPEQDNDKTTTRQKMNLCISIMPFTPGLSDLV